MSRTAFRVTRTRNEPPAPIAARPKRSSGSPFAAVVILLALGAAGYFGWKALEKRKLDERAAQARYQMQLEEAKRIEAEQDRLYKEREKARAEAKRKKAEELEAKRKEDLAKRKRLEEMMEGGEWTPKREDKEKSLREIVAEDVAVRKDALAKLAEARKNPGGTTIGEFAGVKFGEPLAEGLPVKWGPILDSGDSVAERGAAFATFGPALAKPVMTLSGKPLVWLTPKTRRPWRIEFQKKLAAAPDSMHDPATTNIAATLKRRFSGQAFTLAPQYRRRAGCEFVLVSGQSTVYVGEYANLMKLSIVREDLRLEAKAESDAMRKETLAADAAADDSKLLDSRRYPMGEPADYSNDRLGKFAEGTPRAFCGVAFGLRPKPLTPTATPREGAKCFFLDYRRAKCAPFRGFVHGKAEIDPWRGGVYAVRLVSDGGADGLDDKEYFSVVRESLKRRYGEAEEKKTGLAYPELTFKPGDAEITLAPCAEGGFRLDCVNVALAQIAKSAPAERKAKRRGKR